MEHLVITIGCEYGAKGNMIGRKVAKDLGIKFYDRDTVDKIIKEVGIPKDLSLIHILEKYREKMLGELERLDQETGSEYIRILKCYLETNGNIGEVATECYLHRNTVSYHLKKIAEITGKTLNSTKDRSDWYMAYQIDEFLGLI